jgi:hypothetical protein
VLEDNAASALPPALSEPKTDDEGTPRKVAGSQQGSGSATTADDDADAAGMHTPRDASIDGADMDGGDGDVDDVDLDALAASLTPKASGPQGEGEEGEDAWGDWD